MTTYDTHDLAPLRAALGCGLLTGSQPEVMRRIAALRAAERADCDPADLLPLVVAWRDETLVRVDGDDEPTLYHLRDLGDGWQVTPACHLAGDGGWISSITLRPAPPASARAAVLALVRAANPDRRVVVEGEPAAEVLAAEPERVTVLRQGVDCWVADGSSGLVIAALGAARYVAWGWSGGMQAFSRRLGEYPSPAAAVEALSADLATVERWGRIEIEEAP